MSKKAILVPVIFISFVLNGVFQERNLQKKYDGKSFKYATGFMLFQTIFMILVCLVVKVVKREKFQFERLL